MTNNSAPCTALAKVETVDGRKVPVNTFLREAVDVLGLKHEGVASDAGYKGDYWSLVLDAERGIKLDRLGCLPIDVQKAFVERWARALGMRLERRSAESQKQALEALGVALRALAEAQ